MKADHVEFDAVVRIDTPGELGYYRRTVFAPLPGPDSDTAKAAAAEVVEASAL